jgi:hypothetical protein
MRMKNDDNIDSCNIPSHGEPKKRGVIGGVDHTGFGRCVALSLPSPDSSEGPTILTFSKRARVEEGKTCLKYKDSISDR